MEGDATNQETRLNNRSAPAAISFERSRIFAAISATALRSAVILAASRARDAPDVPGADFFAAGLAALPLPGLWRMASIRFILSAPILPGKRSQNPYGLGPWIVRGRLHFTGGSRWCLSGRLKSCCMRHEPATYPRHRFPAEIINHAVWLYQVLSPSLRDVELNLAERGIAVAHES